MRSLSYSSLVPCLLVIFAVPSVTSDDKELILVHIVYRHGDRSPLFSFPTDIHQESFWPQGFGYLTQLGMTQHYQLGQYFRSRYIEGVPYHLVNSTYNRHQVHVVSSQNDRALMSASCNLAGMFPPSTSETWNTRLPWQPIPVHPLDTNSDFLRVESCQKAFAIYQMEPINGERGKHIASQNTEFFAFVAEKTGMIRQPTLYAVSGIAEPLYSEIYHDLPLPDWVNQLWNDGRKVLDKILELSDVVFLLKHTAPGVKPLLGGGLLNDIVERMGEKVGGTSEREDKKLYMYSSHDSTVAALMSVMNVFNNAPPPYASSIMIELFNISGQFAVELWYKNDTTREPYQLTIPGCSSTCPLDQFTELLKDNIVDDWQTQCRMESSESHSLTALTPPQDQITNMSLVIATSCIIILTITSMLVALVVQLRTRDNTRWFQYQCRRFHRL